ncbi:hypothetical protein J3F83DRAFT_337418 [Trichoderma novae-zelandiae]
MPPSAPPQPSPLLLFCPIFPSHGRSPAQLSPAQPRSLLACRLRKTGAAHADASLDSTAAHPPRPKADTSLLGAIGWITGNPYGGGFAGSQVRDSGRSSSDAAAARGKAQRYRGCSSTRPASGLYSICTRTPGCSRRLGLCVASIVQVSSSCNSVPVGVPVPASSPRAKTERLNRRRCPRISIRSDVELSLITPLVDPVSLALKPPFPLVCCLSSCSPVPVCPVLSCPVLSCPGPSLPQPADPRVQGRFFVFPHRHPPARQAGKGSIQLSRAPEPMRGALSTPLCRGSKSQSVCACMLESWISSSRTSDSCPGGGWATHSAHQGSVCVSSCKQIHWPGPVTTTASTAPQSLRRPKRLHLLIIPPSRRWTARPSPPVS